MPSLGCEVPLRYGDIDRQGHVNNSAILQIVESARMVLWQRALLPSNPGQVIRRQSIEYLSPISADHGSVRVEHVCVKTGNSSYVLRFEVWGAGGVLFSEGLILMVAVDSHGVPQPIPPQLRRELESMASEQDSDIDFTVNRPRTSSDNAS